MYNIPNFQTQNRYSRSSAVNYALAHGLNPNPNYRYFQLIGDNGGDCTNFMSQCILAGGARMEFNTSRPWWYKHGITRAQDKWSICWATAHSFYYYLRVNAEKNSPYAKGIEVASSEMLEPGDIIFFQNSSGKIFHACMVTDFFMGEILVTQHSYDAVNIPYKHSWPVFKYHYVKIVI